LLLNGWKITSKELENGSYAVTVVALVESFLV